jgi:hypothetical protein
MTPDVTVVWDNHGTTNSDREAVMRMLIGMGIMLFWAAVSYAESGFDQRYERDYNIFNPINRYEPDNPLNPVNKFDPDNTFNPVNRYDPGNPTNPINQYNPNNPFNSINRYHPDNPLNPVNKHNPSVPFAPLDGGGMKRSR